jgi:hypothetical protein
MRALALALGIAVLCVTPASARAPGFKIAYVLDRHGLVVYADSALRQPISLPRYGEPRWSGDGRLVSFGGYVVASGTQLPTDDVAWAATGERAAYASKSEGVSIWSPSGHGRRVVREGWGAVSLAWSPNGTLAVGRAVCRLQCGRPKQTGVWAWRNGSLRKLVATDGGMPRVFAWHRGRVLWWDWPNSGSIAADGVGLYEGSRRVATMLMYPDYVAVCGSHLAVAAGGDRYAMHGKRILFDGRDVSRDATHSWVSPSCTAGGRLVAAASANAVPARIGAEHRAIWQLLPARRQLTHPPAGWTDEDPHLLADGAVFFVRTRETSFKRHGDWWTRTRGRFELLNGGKLTDLHDISFSASQSTGELVDYYGHYDWPSRLALSP